MKAFALILLSEDDSVNKARAAMLGVTPMNELPWGTDERAAMEWF